MKLIVKINYAAAETPHGSNVDVVLYEPKRDARARYQEVDHRHYGTTNWPGETEAVNTIIAQQPEYRGIVKTVIVVASGEHGFNHEPYVFQKL
jgi:hypothetical protein